jgi:hypothetical protein
MCGTMTNEEVNRNDQTTQCVEAEVGALKRHITQLENDVLSTKWVWMMNYCKTHRVSPTLGWESAEKAWRKAKEAKPCIKQLKTKSCIYCMKVECECSDFDVSADMGAKG